jgi:dipeptidyl aminopeptidase/acylaminoacyl peptidase
MRKLDVLTGARFAAAMLLTALAMPATAAAQALDLAALMSPPFPSNLTASPTGGKLVWVMNEEGARNLWIADAPDYVGRRLTHYQEDDGQVLGSPAITPDGATVVFVRGGGANRKGEIPNPMSDPAGAEQALWRIGAEGGEPVRIGAGSSPTTAPDGDGVAYLRGGQIWWASLSGENDPDVLVSARGSAGSLRWSPDGARLAFVSRRGDHSFVGVYDRAASSVTWLAPSVDTDSDPVWSRDGRQIAFRRTPARSPLEPPIFRPVREARPWSIHVVDLESGAAGEVWRAEEGVGSAFHGVVAENQLFWGADDRIVFPWERTGWTLLYSVPANGGPATLLTPGEFEVEHVQISADGRELFYSSNQGDIDRRHLWRVDVRRGRPTAITRGEGIEWSPTPTANGAALAYLRSDARTPAHAVVRVGDADARELAPGSIPADFPSARLVIPQAVTLTAADGMQVPAQLFLPREVRRGERRPALVFMHGGSRRQMLLGFHHSSYYHNAYAMNQYLASQGYVVLSLNYRSGIGYGLEFREALDYGATGGSEFYDVLGAGLYLRGRPDVDPARIGLWGGSYGGYLTAMGLSRASDLFAAGVDIHGVHDWNVGIRNFVPDYDVLESPEAAALAFRASPMSSVDRWRSPVLLIHGDDDRNVAFAETVTLMEALRDRGVEVEQLVFPDEVHSFLRHENWLSAFRAASDFFARRLGTDPGRR